jgi:hypothetical protein
VVRLLSIIFFNVTNASPNDGEWGWHDLTFVKKLSDLKSTTNYTGCSKNGVLTVHYGVEEITVNVRKMLKKFYWTYLLI